MYLQHVVALEMVSERPSWNIDTPIGGSKGALGTRPLSLDPISLIFMQFSAIIWSNIRFSAQTQELALPSG